MSSTNNAWKISNLYKLIPIIAIALLAISFVAAASFGDTVGSMANSVKSAIGEYQISAINGFVIAAVLMIIVALAGKSLEKENRMIVQGLLLVFAFAAGFMNPDLKATYIWQMSWVANFLHIKVIVNIVLITAFMYIVANFFKLNEKVGQGDWGKYAVMLLCFAIAANISLAPFEGGKAYNDATYKYIWEEENIVEARFYLMGDSLCQVHTEEVASAYGNLKDAVANNDTEEINQSASKLAKLLQKAQPEKYCYTQETIDRAIKKQPHTTTYVVNRSDKGFKGFGVLRGKQLFIMIGLGIMLYWFFDVFGIVGGMKELNIIVAILIAASMAHNGLSVGSAVGLGEVLFAMIIFKAINEKSGIKDIITDKKWVFIINAILSAGLTHWLTTFAFGDIVDLSIDTSNGGGGIATAFEIMFGLAGYWAYNAAGMWGLIIQWAIIFLIAYSAGRSGDRGQGNVWGFLRQKGKRVWNISWLHIPFIGKWLARKGKLQDITQEGTIPDEFRIHYPLMQVLMNWMLRLEVFLNKKDTVRKRANEASAIYGKGDQKIEIEGFEALGNETSFTRFQMQVDIFKNGAPFTTYNEKKLPPWKLKELNDKLRLIGGYDADLEKPQRYYIDETYIKRNYFKYGEKDTLRGALQTYSLIITLFENMAKRIAPENNSWITQVDEGGRLSSYTVEYYKEPIARVLGNMSTRLDEFKKAHLKYGIIKFINARRAFMLDQYLMCGEWLHSYRFATPDAPVYYYDYTINTVNEADLEYVEDENGNKITAERCLGNRSYALKDKVLAQTTMRYAGPYGKLSKPMTIDTGDDKSRPEVWFDGTYLEDLNGINMKLRAGMPIDEVKKQHPYVRRLKQFIYGITVTHNAMYHNIMNYDLYEWDGWNTDLILGEFKPMSRSARDYRIAYEDDNNRSMNALNFKNPEKGRKKELPSHIHSPIDYWEPIGDKRPAYDEEGIKDPGRLNYWGRKVWSSEDNSEINKIEPFSPYPGISVKGLTEFIKFYFEEKLGRSKEMLEFMNVHTLYSGNEKAPFVKGAESVIHGDKKEGGGAH